ncbi:MAG: recombinase family protein [Mogibacterium sp.]|nr:recombinase family protein [Mogibacterium sp.]
MIALYCRVSTREQSLEGYSIGEQQERLKNYCAAMNWKNFKLYVDGGYSGGTMQRPALQNMISDIKKGLVEKVVVYKLDRLSRSQKDSLVLIEDIFLKNNVDFISMSENFDTSTPFGRAMIGILSVFAQLEREQIKERMIMGIEARAKEGKYCGSCSPIGYDYIDGELKINDFEALQVREAFELILEDMSPRRIAKIFNEKGYKTKFGSWSGDRVRYVLKSPLYVGRVKYAGEYFNGIHEAIVSDETFEDAQKILEKRFEEVKANRNPGRATSYLGGFLICGRCGAKYTKQLQLSKRSDGSYYRYHYFVCNSRNKKRAESVRDPHCKNKNWNIEKLTNIIFDEIRKLSLDPNYFEEIRDDSIQEDKRSILEAEIEKIDGQLSRVMDLYILENIPIKALEEKTNSLNEQRRKLEQEVESLEEKKSEKLSKEEAGDLIQNFDDIIKRANFEEIRSVLSALIEKIVLDGENIEIHWRF